MSDFDDLVDYIDQPGIDGDATRDIAKMRPGISRLEALQVQLAVKRRQAKAGDRIIGHQASFTSAGIRKMFPDAPRPMIGTLMASLVRGDGDEVALDCEEAFIESEMAMVLKHDIEGPNVTPIEVLAAVEGFFPAIEVAPLRPRVREGHYSYEHMIATQKAKGGFVIFGSRITAAHGFDPRLEGCLVSIDGTARSGATGFEAMGNPLTVVAAVAAGLHEMGEKLYAGQILMTGSLAPPQVITRANRIAELEIQTLGRVSVRIAE